MNTFVTVAAILVSLSVVTEAITFLYIVKNRSWAIPRIRASLRYFLGTADVADQLQEVNHNLRKLRASARKSAKAADAQLQSVQPARITDFGDF